MDNSKKNTSSNVGDDKAEKRTVKRKSTPEVVESTSSKKKRPTVNWKDDELTSSQDTIIFNHTQDEYGLNDLTQKQSITLHDNDSDSETESDVILISDDDDEDDLDDYDGNRNGEYYTLKDTISRKLSIKIDGGIVYIRKDSFAASRNLRFPEKVAIKLFEKIGKIKHTYSEVVKRHKTDHDVREAAQVALSRKPFYQCTFTKISNYWYADVRRFKGQEGTRYQKDNGICFPVEDLLQVNRYLTRKLNIKQRE